MTARHVVEHALTVYYDGDAELARKVADLFAEEERAQAMAVQAEAEGSTDEQPR